MNKYKVILGSMEHIIFADAFEIKDMRADLEFIREGKVVAFFCAWHGVVIIHEENKDKITQ